MNFEITATRKNKVAVNDEIRSKSLFNFRDVFPMRQKRYDVCDELYLIFNHRHMSFNYNHEAYFLYCKVISNNGLEYYIPKNYSEEYIENKKLVTTMISNHMNSIKEADCEYKRASIVENIFYILSKNLSYLKKYPTFYKTTCNKLHEFEKDTCGRYIFYKYDYLLPKPCAYCKKVNEKFIYKYCNEKCKNTHTYEIILKDKISQKICKDIFEEIKNYL